jgi:hypothetical protein
MKCCADSNEESKLKLTVTLDYYDGTSEYKSCYPDEIGSMTAIYFMQKDVVSITITREKPLSRLIPGEDIKKF